MITLYGFGKVHPKVIGETRDLRAQWALEETGLEYKVQGLDHSAGDLSAPAYDKMSYFNQVPIIDDDGFVLSESAAIVLYLAEKSKKLIPSDFKGRTQVQQWSFVALTTLEPPLAELLMQSMMDPDDSTKRRDYLINWANRCLAGIEKRLIGRTWIAADDFTVADILTTSVLREIRKLDLMEAYPRIKDYYQRAQARPAWQRTLEKYAQRLGVTPADIR